MKTMLALLGMIVTTLAGAAVASAQSPVPEAQSVFRFDLQEADGPRGLGVEGYVYNGLPWRITNVQLQVDSVDANGRVIASASGWILGDVTAGGRGYFYVPVSSAAPTYRASIRSFDKVAREEPRFEAP